MPIVWQKTRVGDSHEWELEQITFAGGNWSTSSIGGISGICTANTLGVSRFCTADIACAPSILGFDTAGT